MAISTPKELSNADSQWQASEIALPYGRTLKRKDEETYEMTAYHGEPATQAEIANEIAKLQSIYPQTNASVMATIVQYVAEDNWTLQRLKDAVKKVITTNQYPTISPAAILGYDRPKRLYNYLGYCNKIGRGEAVHSDFEMIDINGKKFWALKSEQISR